jgi:hypothetical protein
VWHWSEVETQEPVWEQRIGVDSGHWTTGEHWEVIFTHSRLGQRKVAFTGQGISDLQMEESPTHSPLEQMTGLSVGQLTEGEQPISPKMLVGVGWQVLSEQRKGVVTLQPLVVRQLIEEFWQEPSGHWKRPWEAQLRLTERQAEAEAAQEVSRH